MKEWFLMKIFLKMVKNRIFHHFSMISHNNHLNGNESHFLPISPTKSSHVTNINCLIMGLI